MDLSVNPVTMGTVLTFVYVMFTSAYHNPPKHSLNCPFSQQSTATAEPFTTDTTRHPTK